MPTVDGLEQLLARARAGEVEMAAVLGALADTELYLPIDDATSFRHRVTADGRRFVPAFTTLAQLRRVEPNTAYLVVAGRDLVAEWSAELWMYLNPDGPTPLLLRADRIRALAGIPVARGRHGPDVSVRRGTPPPSPAAPPA